MKSRFLNAPRALAAVTALTPAICLAQTAAEAPVGATLEEIVVTAQKRAQNLQDVPVSVSAVTAQMFERFVAADLTDISGAIPNVYIQPTVGGSSILAVSIRGIQYAENEKSIEPPVGVVLDGVYLGTAQGGLLESFDLERVEVLRGPQGTLFGKNTTGGVVNAVRTRPTGKLGAKLGATFGSFERRELKAVVNVPIVDQLVAAKVSAFHKTMEGVPNLIVPGRTDGDRDYQSASASVLFTPSTNLELLVTYDYIRDRGEGTPVFNLYQRTPTVLPTQPNIVLPGDTPCLVLNFCPPLDLEHTRINNTGIAYADGDAVAANLNWDLSDSIKLVSVSGWRRSIERIENDFDATEQTIFHTLRPHDGFEQWSQELRLEGDIGKRVGFVAGLFYFESDYATVATRVQDVGYIRGNPALIGVRNAFFPGATVSSITDIEHRGKSYAAFAQVDFRVLDDLTLSAGLRYTKDDKHMTFRIMNPDGTLVGPAQGALVPQSTAADADWGKLTPRLAVEYRVNADVLTYASFTRGFNAGGFSGRAPDVQTIGPYDPEIVDAYEIGVKSEWLDQRLRANLAGFVTQYDDKQEDVNRSTTIPPFFGTTVANASSATIKGFELELTMMPVGGLTLDASLGYLDGSYDDFIADITGRGVTDNSSLKLRRTPELTGAAGAEYRFIAGPGTMAVRSRYRYMDEHELAVSNDPVGHVGAAGYVDASASYEFETGAGNWRVNVYGRNLTDEITKNVYFRAGSFLNLTSAPQGREIGVDLTVTF